VTKLDSRAVAGRRLDTLIKGQKMRFDCERRLMVFMGGLFLRTGGELRLYLR
jgi:hypothetical protein